MNTNTINETVSDGKRAYANWSTLDLCEYMGELHAHHAWLDEQEDEATRTMDGDAEFQARVMTATPFSKNLKNQ